MKLLLAILAVGSAVFWVAISAYRPLDQTLAFGVLGATLLAGVAALSWAAKHGGVDDSDSYLPKPRYVAVACLPWFLALALLLNAFLDHSAPILHRAAVIGKSESAFRERITVTSWRPGRKVESIPLDADLYPKLPEKGPVIVMVKPGLLHIPWVVGFERSYRLNMRAD